LEPGLENYRKQCAGKGLPTDDEITVLYAMFPQQVEALVKGVPPAEAAKPAPAPKPAAPAATPAANGEVVGRSHMILSIDGSRHEVFVEKLRA
jgi:hypothetical protein